MRAELYNESMIEKSSLVAEIEEDWRQSLNSEDASAAVQRMITCPDLRWLNLLQEAQSFASSILPTHYRAIRSREAEVYESISELLIEDMTADRW